MSLSQLPVARNSPKERKGRVLSLTPQTSHGAAQQAAGALPLDAGMTWVQDAGTDADCTPSSCSRVCLMPWWET